MEMTPKIGWCRCCSGQVSDEAQSCPHCGQPFPYHPSREIQPIEVGHTFPARVTEIKDFGAFVEFAGGHKGLVHITELAEFRIKNIFEHVSIGASLRVRVIGRSEHGYIRLTAKGITG